MKPFDLGLKAYSEGEDSESNPYSKNDLRHNKWDDGYYSEKRDCEDEGDENNH